VRTFCEKGEWGLFRCERPHFLVQKKFRFFEIYGVFARTREDGVEPVWTFFVQGVGGQFLRFCADVFYGWLLIEKAKSKAQISRSTVVLARTAMFRCSNVVSTEKYDGFKYYLQKHWNSVYTYTTFFVKFFRLILQTFLLYLLRVL